MENDFKLKLESDNDSNFIKVETKAQKENDSLVNKVMKIENHICLNDRLCFQSL